MLYGWRIHHWAQEKQHFHTVAEPSTIALSVPVVDIAPVPAVNRITCSSGGVQRASASRNRSDSISEPRRTRCSSFFFFDERERVKGQSVHGKNATGSTSQVPRLRQNIAQSRQGSDDAWAQTIHQREGE